MKVKTLNKSLNSLMVLLLLINSYAYFFWHIDNIYYISIIYVLFALYKFNYVFFKKNFFNIILFSVAFLVYSLNNDNAIYVTMYLLLLPLFLSINIKTRHLILSVFINKLLPLLLSLSVISYLLVGLNIISLPSFVVAPINTLKEYNYISYIFFITQQGEPILSRFFGFYDEPGATGTIVAIILFFRSDILKNRVLFIYIFAGALTFSLFFYIVIIYMVIIGKFNKYITSNKKNLIIIGLIILALLFLFPQEILQERIFDRLQFEEGKLSGDNRIGDSFIEYFWSQYIYSKDFLFGTKDIYEYTRGSSSIFGFIYLNGFIIASFITLAYVSFFNKYKQSIYSFITNIILFLMFIYQRPVMFEVFYFVLFTTLVESSFYIKKAEFSKKNIPYNTV